MRVFRVYPHVAGAAREESGHALYRQPRQGAGRIDNPAHYLTLYAAGSPSVSVAEVFASQPSPWNEATLYRADRRPYYVAEIDLPQQNSICDLNDPRALLDRALIPSAIVSKNRERTQAWALGLFRESRWLGVSWWSFYEPDVPAFGLWSLNDASVVGIEPLGTGHQAFMSAAYLLNRDISAG